MVMYSRNIKSCANLTSNGEIVTFDGERFASFYDYCFIFTDPEHESNMSYLSFNYCGTCMTYKNIMSNHVFNTNKEQILYARDYIMEHYEESHDETCSDDETTSFTSQCDHMMQITTENVSVATKQQYAKLLLKWITDELL